MIDDQPQMSVESRVVVRSRGFLTVGRAGRPATEILTEIPNLRRGGIYYV